MKFSNVLAIIFISAMLSTCAAPGKKGLEAGSGMYTYNIPNTENVLNVWYYKPANYTPDSPVLFVLHGLKRNADVYRDGWIENANEKNILILVPELSETLYPGVNGYNLGNMFKAETQDEIAGLSIPTDKNPKELWSYPVIDNVWTDFKTKETTNLEKYFLYGHSAGSQFVHRMMMFTPIAQVEMAIAANAGWYTMPFADVEWNYGLKGTDITQDNIEKFFAKPVYIMLGEKDIDPNHKFLRKTPEAMVQGIHRLERGKYFFNESKKLAESLGVPFNWKLSTAPDVPHSNAKMSKFAANAITEYMKSLNGK